MSIIKFIANADDIFLRQWFGGAQMRLEGELKVENEPWGRGEFVMDLTNDIGGGIMLKYDRNPNHHWGFSYDINISKIEMYIDFVNQKVTVKIGDNFSTYIILEVNSNDIIETKEMLYEIFSVMREEIPEIDFILN